MFKKLLAISFALAACAVSAQQRAEDYFHRGAQFYVFGDKPKATAEVHSGLRRFPDDTDLKELAALLQKEQEQQQKQQQQQQQDSKQEQQQSQSNQDEQQNQQSEQQREEQAKQDQQQREQERRQQEQQKESAAAQPDESDKGEEDRAEAETPPGQMTPQQARQLLDAEKDGERILPIRPEETGQPRSRSIKDW